MKEAKTVEWWEESISEHKKGVIILYRDMYNSRAFLELSKKPTHVLVLLAALNQLYYKKQGNSGKRRMVVQNGGIVYLTQNLLKVRGVKANQTIAEAKQRLWELGFLDVGETGTLFNASVFQVSERWGKYPNGDYHPKEQSLPGKSLYSEHGLKNPDHPVNKERRAKKMSVQKMNEAPIQKMNEESPQIFQ